MRRPVAAVGSAVFFLVGPGTVAGLVLWLLTRWTVSDPLPGWVLLRGIGLVLTVAGLCVLVAAFVRFVAEGAGTPLPAAPPGRLVVGGLYRYVRNPMYVAVIWIVTGQLLMFPTVGLLVYAVAMATFTVCFVRFREEPVLRRRFGADYDEYRAAVSAWWPRLHPWQQGGR
ncbi:isoprenylcysteine carboxyl methyltransferase [Pseudonocardia sp. CNS-004]|nr:isoprenylcysteine carboxyl methyltransferase [Pseudonocardia sp. CNS-004]